MEEETSAPHSRLAYIHLLTSSGSISTTPPQSNSGVLTRKAKIDLQPVPM